jgi:hypothetical protein
MWPHKDLGWWGVVVGIACLVLTVPLNILANFLTPKLRVWWTIRSLGSGTKKLNQLINLAKRLEGEPELSHSATSTLEGQKTLLWGGFCTGYSLLLALIYATGADLSLKGAPLKPGYLKLFLVVAFIQVVVCSYSVAKIQHFLRTSAKGKKRLREEIVRAQRKLQKIVDRTENSKSTG